MRGDRQRWVACARWQETALYLASERARSAFVERLGQFAGDGFDGDIESWALFKRAVDNPNS
jgi:hypothetical protein